MGHLMQPVSYLKGCSDWQQFAAKKQLKVTELKKTFILIAVIVNIL